jgi:hypothetical protein
MQFNNFNFKLVVIESLIELDVLAEEIRQLEDQYATAAPDEGSGIIPEIRNALLTMKIREDQLKQITRLTFDAISDIYQVLSPMWNGEDTAFHVKNISECRLLPNLESFIALTLLDCDDLSPLLDCPNLKKAYIPAYCSTDEATIEKLRAKGVAVTRKYA